MADRVLRGSRLGAVSYETDRNHDLAPRQSMRYACPRGHDFEVPFAGDAEAPATWECRLHGSISRLVDGTEPEQKKSTAQRTSATCPAQKSRTSFSVAPVSATSSATSTRAPDRSTTFGTGGIMIGTGSRPSKP